MKMVIVALVILAVLIFGLANILGWFSDHPKLSTLIKIGIVLIFLLLVLGSGFAWVWNGK